LNGSAILINDCLINEVHIPTIMDALIKLTVLPLTRAIALADVAVGMLRLMKQTEMF